MDELLKMTLTELLQERVRLHGDRLAYRYTDRDYTRTYREFDEETDEIAKGFLAMGLKKGDHIAIWAPNIPEWVLTLFATAKIGGVLVTVNTNYKVFELEYLLKQSDSAALVMAPSFKSTSYAEIINELLPGLAEQDPAKPLHREELPYLRHIFYTGGEGLPGTTPFWSLKELGRSVPDEVLEAAKRDQHYDDVVNMQYTSGTTGFPKGVMLTHYNIINNGKNIGDCMKFTENDKLCIPVPFFHCFGLVLATLASITHSTAMVPIDVFDAKKVMEAIHTERCTAVHGVPTMFIAMLEHPDFSKYDFTSLRTGIMAGSPCPIKVMRQVVDQMHMPEITIAYGMTESSPVSAQTTTDDPLELRVATVGRVHPHVEVKIVDIETGEPVGPGVEGEYCTRGYSVMKGYYKMPEATALAIDKDGWLHSGDVASVDENGYFRITGRIKDMIIRGGENIYPKEIEEFIYTHPAVKDVQVIGVPDKKYGEEAMACIILKEPGSVTVEEMLDYIKASMARHKVPKYIDFVDAFPMNAAGKILKYKMREEATERFGLEGAAGIDTAQTAEQVKR